MATTTERDVVWSCRRRRGHIVLVCFVAVVVLAGGVAGMKAEKEEIGTKLPSQGTSPAGQPASAVSGSVPHTIHLTIQLPPNPGTQLGQLATAGGLRPPDGGATTEAIRQSLAQGNQGSSDAVHAARRSVNQGQQMSLGGMQHLASGVDQVPAGPSQHATGVQSAHENVNPGSHWDHGSRLSMPPQFDRGFSGSTLGRRSQQGITGAGLNQGNLYDPLNHGPYYSQEGSRGLYDSRSGQVTLAAAPPPAEAGESVLDRVRDQQRLHRSVDAHTTAVQVDTQPGPAATTLNHFPGSFQRVGTPNDMRNFQDPRRSQIRRFQDPTSVQNTRSLQSVRTIQNSINFQNSRTFQNPRSFQESSSLQNLRNNQGPRQFSTSASMASMRTSATNTSPLANRMRQRVIGGRQVDRQLQPAAQTSRTLGLRNSNTQIQGTQWTNRRQSLLTSQQLGTSSAVVRPTAQTRTGAGALTTRTNAFNRNSQAPRRPVTAFTGAQRRTRLGGRQQPPDVTLRQRQRQQQRQLRAQQQQQLQQQQLQQQQLQQQTLQQQQLQQQQLQQQQIQQQQLQQQQLVQMQTQQSQATTIVDPGPILDPATVHHSGPFVDTDTSIDELLEMAYGPQISSYPLVTEDSGGVYYISGLDMKLTRSQWNALEPFGFQSRSGARFKRKALVYSLWPGGEVPYEIAAGFDTRAMDLFAWAMSQWMAATCIRFRPATPADANRVVFRPGRGCSSNVGMVGGAQTVTLQDECIQPKIVLHEVGHTLGLIHEHQRPDRDQFITVVRENIRPGGFKDFEQFSPAKVSNFGVSYDYTSIMHYGPNAFSRDGRHVTMVTNNPNFQNVIGKSSRLSQNDVETINRMYQCSGGVSRVVSTGVSPFGATPPFDTPLYQSPLPGSSPVRQSASLPSAARGTLSAGVSSLGDSSFNGAPLGARLSAGATLNSRAQTGLSRLSSNVPPGARVVGGTPLNAAGQISSGRLGTTLSARGPPTIRTETEMEAEGPRLGTGTFSSSASSSASSSTSSGSAGSSDASKGECRDLVAVGCVNQDKDILTSLYGSSLVENCLPLLKSLCEPK